MKIRVPASSANLGPGFDSFGIAWQIYNVIEFTRAEKELTISGCEPRYRGEDNLAAVAFRRTLDACGQRAEGLRIRFVHTEIPVSRGLGSSAALIAAGVTAANGLYGLGLCRGELLDIASAVEGHPDNLAPALFGGLTASLMDGNHAVTRAFPISDRLFFALLIPPFELSTARSRGVMPQEVSMRDAVFNLSRSPLLLRALGDGDGDLLRLAIQDRLHQPYRKSLIEGCEVAEALAKRCGASGLCISGAGSTLLAISDDPQAVPALIREMTKALPDWQVIQAQPDFTGTLCEEE